LTATDSVVTADAAAVAIDHAVVNVLGRMDEAVLRFVSFGFQVTERGHHTLGSINHLMVFEQDYLELIGLPEGPGPVRREVADSPLGLNGLVLATADAAALHASLVARGVDATPPVDFSRPVRRGGATHDAAFRTVRLGAALSRAGRVYFCEHRTPDLVWHPPWQVHPNGCCGIAALTVVTDDPAGLAERHAAALGVPAVRTDDHEVTIPLGDAELRLVSHTRYAERYGVAALRAGGRRDFMGAVSIRTRSPQRLRGFLAAALPAGAVHLEPGRAVVAAAECFDTVLEFVDTPATCERILPGLTKASPSTDPFISAASFQEAARMPTGAAIREVRGGR
jgi:hypothetical protein